MVLSISRYRKGLSLFVLLIFIFNVFFVSPYRAHAFVPVLIEGAVLATEAVEAGLTAEAVEAAAVSVITRTGVQQATGTAARKAAQAWFSRLPAVERGTFLDAVKGAVQSAANSKWLKFILPTSIVSTLALTSDDIYQKSSSDQYIDRNVSSDYVLDSEDYPIEKSGFRITGYGPHPSLSTYEVFHVHESYTGTDRDFSFQKPKPHDFYVKSVIVDNYNRVVATFGSASDASFSTSWTVGGSFGTTGDMYTDSTNIVQSKIPGMTETSFDSSSVPDTGMEVHMPDPSQTSDPVGDVVSNPDLVSEVDPAPAPDPSTLPQPDPTPMEDPYTAPDPSTTTSTPTMDPALRGDDGCGNTTLFGLFTSGLVGCGKINYDKLKFSADGLTTKFPFSIPWDLQKQLSVFNVERQIPIIPVHIATTALGQPINFDFDLDFTMFDPLASVVRWFFNIAVDIGFILMIRKLMPE